MTLDFLSSYRLDITPLSPVHIGSGEDMDPTSYVLDADTLYEFSSSALAAVLDDADRNRLLGLVDGTEGESALTEVRKFLFARRDGLVAYASRAVRAAPGVGELYETRVGTLAQRETKAINRLEIERVFSHPGTRTPILPGSSLKGAVRTALLNQANTGKLGRDARNSQALQKRLFDYNGFETDPMRLVHVADAMGCDGRAMDDFATDTAILFAVNRKKRKITRNDGGEVRSQAEQKGLYQTLEVVPALRWRAFQGGLTIHRTDLRRHKRVPSADLRWSATHIAEACNRFYRRKFEREAEALRDRGLLDECWYVAVKRLMDIGLRELLDSNRAFLLRVGRHSGAESVTLDGVRNIRIMTPQGQADRSEKEATTWWLASERIDASSRLLPFGWVFVEITESAGAPRPLPNVVKSIDTFHAESGEQSWRNEVARHRVAVQQKHKEQFERRAEAARHQREQETAKRKREAKRAAMTDEERLLDDLQGLFDTVQTQREGHRQQRARLVGRTVEILKAAPDWPESTRLQAADLAERIYRQEGFPKGEKGREKKRQIAALREDRR